MKENIPLESEEEMRPIQGYEGLYLITSFGRVWSHLRYYSEKNKWYGGRFRKAYLDSAGYAFLDFNIKNGVKIIGYIF